ncbi:chitobiase/beta-hexosaminidase C-terminal domain-containing protein [Hamadaea tsunoensis]|uniref:chitobiase/beta-hexosaminidase C-terminal domain-containing protein n=1 Tax=Hamadaea tsunoensis TaxID=53368 RepID=UPI0003FA9351|nr:chitobiase/beta-hexosaminidase C-terminal domain-containing protein [Hamadaea tsunoensis]
MNRSSHQPARSRPRTGLIRWAAVASAVILMAVGSATSAAAAADYTQSVTQIDASQAQINFTPTTPALYVDVHYLSPNAGQQNFRMTNNAGTWQKTVGSLTAGFVLEYWFTYEKSGPQFDTPHFFYTQGGAATVATPTFSPPGGSYSSTQSVTLSTTTAGASIRYTVDGSTPTASSTLYSGPISVAATTTIKAIGIASGQTNSAVASATYTINTSTVATPTFNPPGGSYSSTQSVTLSTTTAGASIRYTLDGSTPTASSTLYTGAISVAATTTIKAIGIASGLANSAVATAVYTIGAATCPVQSDTPNFGPNTRIFDPGMSAATIQAQLDADFAAQKDTQTAQMASGRVAHLFKPGTYNVHDDVGFYTSVAGLGQNPDDVTINGDVTVDAFNASDAGNATQNFWRSAENLAITPSSGSDRWAVAQAAPFRRIDVHGGLQLYPASYGWASGGYIADTKVSGQAASVSQQQWYTRDSSLGSWAGGVWNMVFSGTTGAPATTFPSPPETTLATTPVSRDVPYLYIDGTGKYRVFLPSLRTNASGPSWASGSTPGTSLPMSQFYVVKAGDTAATINGALASGCNLFFTPGVYHVNQTLNVTKANAVVLGIGYPTIIPDNGVNAMQVADVDGVRIKGLLFDAGTTNSAALLTVGTSGSTANHAANPTTLQDVFYRIGGATAGKATTSLIVNSNNVIIDHTWAWRADHGNAGTVGWTVNTADTGVLINGNNVLATGLFVEHYQKYEVVWNGQGGKTVFFQNEMPYDVPNQASWNSPAGVNGYAAYKVGAGVTTHEAWGLGSYCYFNVNPAVNSYHAFEVPNTPNVKFHSILTVSLNYQGTITHVINDTGAVTPSGTTPSNVVSFP